MGYLTGDVAADATFGPGDLRAMFPRFTPEALRENRGLVDLLGRIGARAGATPAQVALAWLLAQKPWIVPIPWTRKPARLDENLAALAVRLTPEDLGEIDAVTSTIEVSGARGTGRERYV